MSKIHTTWSLICCIMSVAFFAVGRWSVIPESNQQVHPVSVTDGRQQVTPQSAQNIAVSSNKRNTTESVSLDAGLKGEHRLQQALEQESFESSTDPLPDSPPPHEIDEATGEPYAFAIPKLSPEMIAIQEKENELLKEELTDSLRNSGMSEDEIEKQIEGQLPSPSKIEEMDPQQSADTSPEQLKEEMTASLRETGAPEEEINQITEGFMLSISGAIPSEQPTPEQPAQ
jgi:hypothetical protein